MDKGVYVVSYNPTRKVPNWVSWQLTSASLGKAPRHDRFIADTQLPRGVPRITPADYARSGYDRGHMCPSADRTDSPESNAATFLMTNMQPQLHELNDGPWKELEEHARQVARRGKEVFIVAGGVFGPSPRTIGSAFVAVPDASYKIVVTLEPGQRASDVSASTPVLAVIMPNQPGVGQRRWSDYAVAVDSVEQATHYDFLSNVAVSVQQVIEARVERP